MKRLFTTLAVIAILMFGCKKDKKAVASLTTTAATNVTANSITTGGNITDDGNSAITKRGIAWAIHSAPTVGDSITNDGAGSGSFTSTISNLSSNVTYYIRAYAINGTGTAYGNEITVTTGKGAPAITTAAITNIQPLSAVSGGNITNDGGATVAERGVVYATTANPTINNFKITVGSGTGSFTATLQPLASQQTYYVRAYATNSYGTAYGNQVQFNAASANTITDNDGNVYPYLTVGTQIWMGANLKVTHYNNGDTILNGFTKAGYDWSTTTTGAYTFPNGDQSKKDSFGLYYNVNAIRDSRGVCPAGWHVPSDNDWKTIETYEGMSQTDANSLNLRGTVGAKFLEGGSSGLNLQKAGYLFHIDGSYQSFRTWGVYWSSTPHASIVGDNWYRAFNVNDPDPASIYRQHSAYVMSIRCMKN